MQRLQTDSPDREASLSCLRQAVWRRVQAGLVPPASEGDTSAPITRQAFAEGLTIASRSKLGGVFAAGMAMTSEGPLREEASEWESRFKRQAIAANMSVLSTLELIDETLAPLSIPYAVLKGPIQQERLHGDYFVRPSGDVDLLVARSDFRPAIDALVRQRFLPVPLSNSIWWDRFLGERHLVRSEGARLTIDLHHRLQQPGSPQPRSSRAFLERADRHSFRGRAVPAISRADIPTLCAMNLVKALFNHEAAGNHAFDLAVALRGGEVSAAQEFLTRAKAEDLEGTALLSLRLLAGLFPASTLGEMPRVAAVLPSLSSDTLAAMVLEPELVERWPRRRTILEEACLRAPLRVQREFAWLGASDLARRLFERPHQVERTAAPATTGTAP